MRDVAPPDTTPPGVGAVRGSALRVRDEEEELELLSGMRLGERVSDPVETDPPEDPEDPDDPLPPDAPPEPVLGGAVLGTA